MGDWPRSSPKTCDALAQRQRRKIVAKLTGRTGCTGCSFDFCETTADHRAVSSHDISRQNTRNHTHHDSCGKDVLINLLDNCARTSFVNLSAEKLEGSCSRIKSLRGGLLENSLKTKWSIRIMNNPVPDCLTNTKFCPAWSSSMMVPSRTRFTTPSVASQAWDNSSE